MNRNVVMSDARDREPGRPGPTPVDEAIGHCLEKIRSLVESSDPGRRDLLQLGYNLGRLSELTGGGRGPFWDRWKGPAATWDQAELRRLALALRGEFGGNSSVGSAMLPDQHDPGPPHPISDPPP